MVGVVLVKDEFGAYGKSKSDRVWPARLDEERGACEVKTNPVPLVGPEFHRQP